MKTQIVALLSAGALALASAPALATDSVPAAAEVHLRSAVQLDELLGPIALFPDPLVALILPAAVNSSDVVLAARFRRNGGNPLDIDTKPWDQSVRALAHYPEVLDWLDEHLDWVIELGDAFAAQPAEVMSAVQRLRSLARTAGSLTNTAEQKIVEEDGKIIIEPARPEVIYVPTYDPEVVYLQRSYGGYDPLITFGVGFAIGSWMSYDCDWWDNRVWIGDYYRPWHEHRVWRQPHFGLPIFGGHLPGWHSWNPPVHFRRHAGAPQPWTPDRFRPAPFPRNRDLHGAPRPHFDSREPGGRNEHGPSQNYGDRRDFSPRDSRSPGPEGRPRPSVGASVSRGTERVDRPYDAGRTRVGPEHRSERPATPPAGSFRREVTAPPYHSVIPSDRPVSRPVHGGDFARRSERSPSMPSAPAPRSERSFHPSAPPAQQSVSRAPSAPPAMRQAPSAPPQMHQSSPPVHVQSSSPAPVRESSAPASRGDSGNRGHNSRENER